MSNNYSIHLYIEGPDEDLQKVTKDLDFSKQSYDDTSWEIEGGSAVLHFETHFCPFDEIKNASAKYPSLYIKFRFTYELINVGLMIYKNGRIKLDSYYDWDTGESNSTKYND